MQLQDKNILLISPEAWGNNFVSKHHYATELAKYNCVFFLNPPSTSDINVKGIAPNISVVEYGGHTKGLRYFPGFLAKRIDRALLKKIEKKCDCSFDIVWSFDNSRFFNFEAFDRCTLKISHIVDLNQDFQTSIAATTADVCLTTTESIKHRLKKWSNSTFKIQHGYTPQAVMPYNFRMGHDDRVKVVYIGNLSIPFIDWKVIREIVEHYEMIDFHFVGPDGDSNLGYETYECVDKQIVKKCANALFCGAVPHHVISSVLQKADVLLVVYQEKYHEQAANPHKILEYLSCGKVIVATYTAEYEGEEDLMAMASRNYQLPDVFRNVVNNLSHYNAADKMKARQAYAASNTYEKQLKRIERILAEEKILDKI